MRAGRHALGRGAALFGGFALGVALLVSLVREARTGELVSGRAPDDAADEQPREPPRWQPRSLRPVTTGPADGPADPVRLRPHRLAASSDGSKVYVTIQGRESAPSSELLVVSIPDRRVIKRVTVGLAPQGLALHPEGRWLLVTNRFSNFVSVVDTESNTVASRIPVPFYCEDIVVARDGRRAYLSNFWKGQVIVVELEQGDGVLAGSTLDLGFDRAGFLGARKTTSSETHVCEECGWAAAAKDHCPRCGSSRIRTRTVSIEARAAVGINGILRSRCGQAGCHLYANRTFVAGPDTEENFRHATSLAFPEAPDDSPLLRLTRSLAAGGTADAVDGRHHVGGVVFEDTADPDYRTLRAWIAAGRRGPGIDVGQQPRDLLLSPDGALLYVANTGSVDVSVVDLESLSETRRIFVRSPVNDLVWLGEDLLFATLGVGSGHPAKRNPARESLDREGPDTEFTLWRDLDTGAPRPLAQQRPMGPYDDVDGTAQEKFRDISNDLVLLDPGVDDVARYAATEAFTRYTSDSFEALPGDVKGDVAPGLMRVVGAFPEQATVVGDHAYVTMSGTSQVQEWRHVPGAPPEHRLQPGRVFETGFLPTDVVAVGDVLVVVEQLSDSLSFIELATGATTTLTLDVEGPRFPASDFERGEMLARTSLFSADQDQSCVHCHYRDTSDGKRWSVSQVMGQSRDGHERTGGSREVPDLRNLAAETPFFLEGTLSIDEPLTMMMEHNPLVDFSGPTPAGDYTSVVASAEELERFGRSADAIVVATGRVATNGRVRTVDLIKRRERFFHEASRRHMGQEIGFREAQRLLGVFQASESRLLPNPEDPDDPMVRRGRAIFLSPETGCAGCHPPPNFKDTQHVANANGAFPPLVTAAPRDDVHTLISADRLDAIMGFVRPWDPDDPGRVEAHEGFFVAPSLRGLWARPARFLHHGRALSLREVISPPHHPGLRQRRIGRRDPERPGGIELGLNERDGMIDTHGATSHLGVWDLECLRRFLLSIE